MEKDILKQKIEIQEANDYVEVSNLLNTILTQYGKTKVLSEQMPHYSHYDMRTSAFCENDYTVISTEIKKLNSNYKEHIIKPLKINELKKEKNGIVVYIMGGLYFIYNISKLDFENRKTVKPLVYKVQFDPSKEKEMQEHYVLNFDEAKIYDKYGTNISTAEAKKRLSEKR